MKEGNDVSVLYLCCSLASDPVAVALQRMKLSSTSSSQVMQHLPSLEQQGNTDTLVISADSTALRVASESLSFGLSPSEMHSHPSLS